MALERIADWLSKNMQGWKAKLSIAIGVGLGALGAWLPSLLPQSKDWQLSLRIVGVAAPTVLLLLLWMLTYMARAGSLKADLREARGENLDRDDWKVLDLIYNHDPQRYSIDDLKGLASLDETVLRGSLRKLKDKEYIGIKDMRKHHVAETTNPNRIILRQEGLILMKQRKAEQGDGGDGAQPPPVPRCR